MKNKFNVVVENNQRYEPYDILGYLGRVWGELKPSQKNKALLDLQGWIDSELKYQFWSRCEYEILLLPWPPGPNDKAKKVDVYDQCLLNLEVITRLFAQNEGIF